MLFPKVNQSKVKYHTVLMALSIESEYGSQLYGRKYYFVKYEDNSELIFFTTNEPDSDFDENPLDEVFILVQNFEEMMNNFENTEIIGLAIDTKFNSPPKFIYYDIITIDDSIKPLILEHLKEKISGFTELDFNMKEKKQIKIWLDYLSD